MNATTRLRPAAATPLDNQAAALLLCAESEQAGHLRGSAAYRATSVALFLAGFATFSLLYCVQPLLPEFTRDYGVTPAASAMALSLTTGALAVAIFASGALSQLLPRRGLMFGSMALAALCNLAAAAAPSWPALLAARFAEGAVLGGVPAVAMAYLAEEMHARDLGQAMGLYVAGTAFGGMMGRVGMGLLTEVGSWRMAMAVLGGLGLASAFGFALLLPASRRFQVERGFDLSRHARTWRAHLGRASLLRLFVVGFLLTSVFVTLFNYAGFRLTGAPFGLGQTAISLIFLSYIMGIFVSPWAGRLADRFGQRGPLAAAMALMGVGALVTLPASLSLVTLGILLVTLGFFAAHSVASGWVGQLAGDAKGHASSLYLLFYYVGSSVTGSLGGWFWQHLGWGGVVGLCAGLSLAGVLVAAGVAEDAGNQSAAVG